MDNFSIGSKISRTVSVEGKEYLYFSGTAYLGMNSLPAFEELVREGIAQYGTNYGASRKSNVQLKVYEEMEDLFALQAEAGKAAVVSSGLTAGQLAVTLLKALADTVWVAPDAHPAIIPDGILPNSSKTFTQFTQQCVEESHTLQGKTVTIFANTVDPLTPYIYSYEWVRGLSRHNTYYLLLDDSHAFGLIGKGIFGSYSRWKNLPVRLIICGSLGKALGIPAGIILGPDEFIQKIVSHPNFVGASPPAPAFCQAFLNAQSLYALQQEKLQENCTHFLSSVQGVKGLNYEKNFPVVRFEGPGWAVKLLEKQILISSFPYPHPDSAHLDRAIVSAYHTKEDLYQLSSCIKVTTFP